MKKVMILVQQCSLHILVIGKSGCQPEESFDIAQHIMQNCNNLNFSGLMTIGKFGHDYCVGPNPDYIVSYWNLNV